MKNVIAIFSGLIIFLLFAGLKCFSQNIQISNTGLNATPFGNNSSLTVKVKLNSCFNKGNQFKLVLSNISGVFGTGESVLKTYNGFFTTFLNGELPNVSASSTYKLRVVSTSPADTSNEISGFEIKNQGFKPNISLNADQLINDSICGTSTADKVNPNTSINFEIPNPTGVTALLTKPESGATSNISLSGNAFSLLTPIGAYWIVTLIHNSNGLNSARSFLVLNTTNTTSLTNNNSEIFCNPDNAPYNVDISNANGVGYNYPGSYYRFLWGDNSGETFITHCRILQNNVVSHNFSNPSCGSSVFSTTGGKFTVKQELYNPEGQNFVDEPFNEKTSSPVVFKQPQADFVSIPFVCVNSEIRFVNNSTPGAYYDKNISICGIKMKFTWRVDDVRVRPQSLGGGQDWSEWPDLLFTFSTPGKHKIVLIAQNDIQSNCAGDSIVKYICIEPRPVPKFLVNGKDSLAECASSSLQVKTTNNTTANSCRNNIWQWSVYNDSSNVLLSRGIDYSISPNDTAQAPIFTFTVPGRYRIVLQVTNSCGTFEDSHIVKFLSTGGSGAVSLPATKGYCISSTVIDFSSNAAHKPSYSSDDVGDTYSWTVAGPSTYSFKSPTTANSRYPITEFNGYGTYKVTVTFNSSNNKCGLQSASQQIILSAPVVVDAGDPNMSVCYNVDSIVLAGSVNPAVAVKWTSTGKGVFNPDNNVKSVYRLTAEDKNTSDIILKLSADDGGACAGSSDEIKVKIYPENAGTKKIDTICSGSKLSYNPTSAVAGSTFTWTSVVSKGTITGNSATGAAAIVDVLVNTNATTDGEVVYTITPRANNCDGVPFMYSIVVRPRPTLNAKADTNTICSNSSIAIRLSSNLSGSNYSWSSTVISGTASGNSVLANQNVAAINDVLSNTSNTNAIVRYKIVAISGCASDTSTVDVTVLPGSTKADAGQNQYLCNKNSATLVGNTPAVGTGKWIQTSGPSATIETPANATTVVSGLSANNIYNFGWVITGNSNACGSDTSNVFITVRPPLTIPNAGDTINLCTTNGNVVTLNANAVQSPETGKWTVGAGTIGAVVITNPSSAVTTATGLGVGTKYLVWTITNDANCPPLSDIVVINVGAGADAADAGNDQELCNTTQANLAGNTPSSGAGKWRQISGPSTSNIVSDISPNTAVSGLINGTYEFEWSLAAGGTSSCGNSIDTVRVVIYPAVQAGVAPLTQTICSGGTITMKSNAPTGGNGTYKYQWQSSSNNTNFNDIVGESNASLTASPATDTWYRVVITSGPCSTPTVAAAVIVQPGISNNTIAANQEICIGNTPALIVGNTPVGGDGIFTYQWQSSADSVNWINVGVSSKDYQPALITSSLVYRRIVKTALCDAVSNTVTVTVNPDAKALFQPLKSVDCAPFNITPTVINQTAYADRNGTFIWSANNNAIGSGVFPGYTIANAGDSVLIKLVAVSKFGCKNDSMQAWFFSPINPKPAFSLSDSVGCGPLVITLTNTTPDASNFNFLWDFGNGETSTQQQPGTINFLANPNFGDTIYTVRLKATGGCDTIAAVHSIRVKSLPKSLFTPDIVEGCSPMKVTFTNTSRGSNATFVWDFGDGSAQVPAINPSIQHIFNTGVKDTFYVKLYGSNDCGKDTQQYAIVVNPNRIRLDFAVNGNQKNVCIPDTILFVNNTTGANKFEWDFGDGSPKLTTTKGIDSVYHEYTQRGVYTVTLFGTNGCSDTTSTETITVENRPNVSFTATPSEVCLGGTIQMTNTSDTSLAWAWDFGDGSTSSQLNPAKTYTNTGNYIIALTGTKIYPQGFGCPATATANVVVNGPAGELRYKAVFTCLGDAIQLETISNNTTQYRYYLGNGDSIVSNTPVVNYTYKLPGTYLPSVLLVAGNCSKLMKGVDSIKIDRMQAGFKFNPVYSCGATRINFTDTSDAYFGIVKREWDFGDGTTASTANPFKTYNSAGSYNVRLRITGASGCTGVFDTLINVQVRDIPVAAISSDNFACTNNRVLFIAATQSIDAIVGHNWNFGNNTTGTGDIAATTYNSTGIFTVRLISRTSFGCADTVTKAITVRQSPAVTASADVRICLGQSTQLNVSGATAYQWSPAEGLSCTNCANPIASPTITTQYLVTGINAIGCPNTDSVTVEVVQPFTMTLTANDTLCIGQSSQLFASGANRYVWNPSVGLTASNIPNPIATPNSTTNYRVVGFDSYNCFTDTAYTVVAVGGYPTVELGRGDTVVAGTVITFKPILTNGPFKNFFWTPTTGLSPNNVQNPVATINNSITYTLVAENIYGCTGTDTISYQVFCSKDDQAYIPNAFSPDGDGVNDVFMVYGKGIKVDYFRVYNRWGQVVFDGGSNYLPNLPQFGWNGRVGGKPATQDVYVYMVQLKCTAGGTFTYKGNVSLLLMR